MAARISSRLQPIQTDGLEIEHTASFCYTPGSDVDGETHVASVGCVVTTGRTVAATIGHGSPAIAVLGLPRFANTLFCQMLFYFMMKTQEATESIQLYWL